MNKGRRRKERREGRRIYKKEREEGESLRRCQ